MPGVADAFRRTARQEIHRQLRRFGECGRFVASRRSHNRLQHIQNAHFFGREHHCKFGHHQSYLKTATLLPHRRGTGQGFRMFGSIHQEELAKVPGGRRHRSLRHWPGAIRHTSRQHDASLAMSGDSLFRPAWRRRANAWSCELEPFPLRSRRHTHRNGRPYPSLKPEVRHPHYQSTPTPQS